VRYNHERLFFHTREERSCRSCFTPAPALKTVRKRIAKTRDAFAKTLAAPFDRGKAERARLQFIETLAVIDAIDRAIGGEQAQRAATA